MHRNKTKAMFNCNIQKKIKMDDEEFDEVQQGIYILQVITLKKMKIKRHIKTVMKSFNNNRKIMKCDLPLCYKI